MSGWFGVDLDGTLAHYEYGDLRRHGDLYIGEPIPRMVERIKRWHAKGITVKIFTARVSHNHPGDMEIIRKRIQEWALEHIGLELEVTNVKDYKMIMLWDDRSVEVIPNTGISRKEMHDIRGRIIDKLVAMHAVDSVTLNQIVEEAENEVFNGDTE